MPKNRIPIFSECWSLTFEDKEAMLDYGHSEDYIPWRRVDGNCVCQFCGNTYRNHPTAPPPLDMDVMIWVYRTLLIARRCWENLTYERTCFN